ncbi:MAG: threonine synthase [Anaerolinea sp.]|nr:threonine synthase [Anaerolinea sp.]
MGRPSRGVLVHDDGTEEIVAPASIMIDDFGARLLLEYEYGPEMLPSNAVSSEALTAAGMWRYSALLPIDESPIVYPLPVGGTPLVAPPVLRASIGLPNLWLKDETRGPSGSNKDRATALVLQQAMSSGVSRVTSASTGNVAVSLAVGAAAAGKEAVNFVASDVDDGKLALMRHVGATVIKVQGGYEAAFRLSRQAAREFGWIDRNTGVNPVTVEAKKTVAFEIWEQLGGEVPDVVAVPVGDGPTLNGIAKGFRELVACGVAAAVPVLVGVQADGCQPVKRAWEVGGRVEATAAHTIADGIGVSRPISGALAVRDVVASAGFFVSVTDAQMLEAMALLGASAGVLAEPAGAASLAGLLVAVREGRLASNARMVALVTGSALKTPRFYQIGGRVAEISADLDELSRVLRSLDSAIPISRGRMHRPSDEGARPGGPIRHLRR